jgi:hypothetical protein
MFTLPTKNRRTIIELLRMFIKVLGDINKPVKDNIKIFSRRSFEEEVIITTTIHFIWKPVLVYTNNRMIYETGDDIDEEDLEYYNEQLEKSMTDIEINNNSIIVVEDFSQDISWKITMLNNNEDVSEFKISGNLNVEHKKMKVVDPNEVIEKKEIVQNNEIIHLDDDDSIQNKKRKREGEIDQTNSKKMKDDDSIEID